MSSLNAKCVDLKRPDEIARCQEFKDLIKLSSILTTFPACAVFWSNRHHVRKLAWDELCFSTTMARLYERRWWFEQSYTPLEPDLCFCVDLTQSPPLLPMFIASCERWRRCGVNLLVQPQRDTDQWIPDIFQRATGFRHYLSPRLFYLTSDFRD